MPKLKKQYGQYMTPEIITDFMVELISHKKNCSVLEPACGNGAFIYSLNNHGFNNVKAFEIDETLISSDLDVNNESFVSANDIGTFDVVIGNPPYIRWKNLEDNLKDELSNNELWNIYCNSLCDYSNIFILKSIELLNDNGELIFITPEYWITTTHAQKLRNYMVSQGYLECIYHFNESPIFKDVIVSLVVFKFVKSKNPSKSLKIVKCKKKNKLSSQDIIDIKSDNPSIVESFYIPHFKENETWVLADLTVKSSLNQYEKACTKQGSSYEKFGDYFDIGNGMVSGLDKAFQIPKEMDLTKKELESVIKVIKAKDLKGYLYEKITNYIFITKNISETDLLNDYPNFYDLLSGYKEKLLGRYNYGKDIGYWEWVFLRNINLFNKKSSKLFVPCKERITNKKQFRFTYVEEAFFPTQDVTAIYKKSNTKEDLLYVLALLNSSYVFKWLTNKGIKKGDIVEFSEKPISQIPYRTINFKDDSEVRIHDEIVSEMKLYLTKKDEVSLKKISLLIDKLMEL